MFNKAKLENKIDTSNRLSHFYNIFVNTYKTLEYENYC